MPIRYNGDHMKTSICPSCERTGNEGEGCSYCPGFWYEESTMVYVVTCSETDDGVNWSYRVDSVFYDRKQAEDHAAKVWGDVHVCQAKGKSNEVQQSKH